MGRYAAVLLAAALLCGCETSGAMRASVRDSAGIVIVENTFPDSAAATWWRLETEPVLDIGGADADETSALFRVSDALRLSDGRIVVASGGSADVRYYSAQGAHVRTTGRRGDGPGEFQRPDRLFVLPGDSVAVAEALTGRVTVLDPAGAVVRDFLPGGSVSSTAVVGRMSDGTFVTTRNNVGRDGFQSGHQRLPITFVRLAADGALLDSLLTVPGAEMTINVVGTPGRVESIRSIELVRPPYSKRTVYAAAANLLAAATQEAPEVRLYGLDGTVQRIVRTGTPMPAVTDAHLDAWHQRSLQLMPEPLRAQARQRPDWPHAGSRVPPFEAIEIDDAGNFWLADYDDRIRPPGTWSVHAADGQLLARIRMPATFQPLQIGTDFLLGVERDEVDVEHVRMYRLLR